MRTHSWSAVALVASQFAVAAAIAASEPGAEVDAAEATWVRSEVLADDPADRPPAGTQLAFVRDDQIWLANADGTGLTRLTHTGSGTADSDPAWSRDGQRLAFARSDAGGDGYGTSHIYVMNADGSNVVRLTRGAEPSWGPDGRTIVFTGGSGLSAIVDTGVDGGEESKDLLDRPGWVGQPAWSPDGRTITFTSDYRAYDFLFDLYAMNADGSNVRALLHGPFFWNEGPIFYFQSAWSPDGQRIGVGLCRDSWTLCNLEGGAIAVADADGAGLRVLTQAGTWVKGAPTWSPDGRWIAYGSRPCTTCPSSIRFVQVDGDNDGLIVENGLDPAWRPEAGARINSGHSGAWFNPATSGQGQFLDVEPDRQFVFLGWFTYTDEASENAGQQHWFTAQGHYDGTKAELTLYESLGGRFDQAQAVTTTPVGEVTLTFSGCGHGAMSYRFEDRELAGSFPLMRAISGSESECERRTESAPQGVDVNHGMDGAWFDPTTSGQGFLFDVHANEDGGEFMFVSWFTYGDDTATGQRWLTAEGPFEGSRADLVIHDTRGGSFDDPQSAASVPVGTMSIDFADCRNALLSYSLDDGQLAGAMAVSRLLPGGQAVCEELATAAGR